MALCEVLALPALSEELAVAYGAAKQSDFLETDATPDGSVCLKPAGPARRTLETPVIGAAPLAPPLRRCPPGLPIVKVSNGGTRVLLVAVWRIPEHYGPRGRVAADSRAKVSNDPLKTESS